ncbi:MAG: transcriptional repressor [Deltaproteobacteria bacterium]|nr:transcriptional repressor [Deltaproteobacteria bacterium]
MIIISVMADKEAISKNFKKYLSSRGLRRTLQRDVIVREIIKSAKHLTADEIFERLRKKNPNIGYATVCRNLKLLYSAGIIDEIKIGNQKTRYELKSEDSHHDHLICVKCGKFIEVFSEKIEELQKEMARKERFIVLRHKLEIYGICKYCGEKGGERS